MPALPGKKAENKGKLGNLGNLTLSTISNQNYADQVINWNNGFPHKCLGLHPLDDL